MIPQDPVITPALLTYMEGLTTQDTGKIASTFADDIRFITPARILRSAEILAFLKALYRAFPDWSYAHDEPLVLGGGRFGVKWRQGGTHRGTLAFPGFSPVPATGRAVIIPEQFFYYRVLGDKLVEIRPDPIPGGAPRGIFEQIGITLPPL